MYSSQERLLDKSNDQTGAHLDILEMMIEKSEEPEEIGELNFMSLTISKDVVAVIPPCMIHSFYQTYPSILDLKNKIDVKLMETSGYQIKVHDVLH